MAYTIAGNNEISGLTLIDPTLEPWHNIYDKCFPYFHTLAAVGMSAMQSGFDQSPNPEEMRELAASGELFDDNGNFANDDLRREMRSDTIPPAEYELHFTNGLLVAQAALVAAKFFGNRDARVRDGPGGSGVWYKRRDKTMPMARNTGEAAGKLIGTEPIQNIELQLVSPEIPYDGYTRTDLTFAVTHAETEEFPTGKSVTLSGTTQNERVSAHIVSHTLEGRFPHLQGESRFSELAGYIAIVQGCIK